MKNATTYLTRFIFTLTLIPLSLKAQTPLQTVKLGETAIQVIHKQRGRGKTLIHLHASETTALKAANQYVQKEGGHLITLKHAGTRNIRFYLHGRRYEFDPNRIFTDKGIRQSLSTYGAYSSEAHQQVRKLARTIVAELPRGKVIALHNNSNYSMQNYFPHQPLAKDARALYHKPQSSLRNFYFVTQAEDFTRLKQKQFNVALQADKAQDDGSLSYYLGRSRYINIEAAYDALPQQLRMLRAA